MIILDASVLIAHLDGDDPLHERGTDLLTAHAGQPMGACVITIAEVLVGPARARRLDAAMGAIEQLGITIHQLEHDAAPRLALLRSEMGLKMPDCSVLLTAEWVRGTLATFDDRLARRALAAGLTVIG